MPAGPIASVQRRLLARVRDIMAGGGAAQARLDRVVTVIATDLVAEVCSLYVRRAGDLLELFATQGLKPEAVHHTHLRVGEGLVGHIAATARPLALADAQNHPLFAYRPETGEEAFHSLMGVPVLRDGRVIGVIVVQNRTPRHYDDEEIEVLQTVAMVLAEVVAGGEVVSRDELAPVDGIQVKPIRIEGVCLNGGIGMGEAVLHQPRFIVETVVAEDPERERARLGRAVKEMHGALDALLSETDIADGGEHRDVLETYRMIAEDAGWLSKIEEAVDSGLTAEAAVQRVQNDVRARLGAVSDPYLRERVHDFDDLANRLMQHLTGRKSAGRGADAPKHMILVARNMGPAELLDYDRANLRGLVLEEGSATAHVVIVAKALDIPVVGQARDVLDRLIEGEQVVVDGDNAQVFLRPGEDVVQAFMENLRASLERKAEYAALKDLPTVTADGAAIALHINAGLLVDMANLEKTGADGVGLYRTEVPFMVRSNFPKVAEQQTLYAKVLAQAEGKPVVFRTLDVGGDKMLPYWDGGHEENPAMGWRAIRLSLDRPAMLRQQLRALIRAAVETGQPLNVMFPMISEPSEFTDARALLNKELSREAALGLGQPSAVRVGAMIEVPGLVFQLPALLAEADFVSVGSNDLVQFMFASDRGNPRVSGRYDPLSPAVLSMLRHVAEVCLASGKPVSLCGEMAGRPLEALALIGIGFRSLSMAPPAIGPVKTAIRQIGLKALADYVGGLISTPDHSLRKKLKAFALDHGVDL